MPLGALYIYLFFISLQSKVQRSLCWALLDCVLSVLYECKLWYIYAVNRLALCFCPELCSSVCPKCLYANLCLRILPGVTGWFSLGGNQHTGESQDS